MILNYKDVVRVSKAYKKQYLQHRTISYKDIQFRSNSQREICALVPLGKNYKYPYEFLKIVEIKERVFRISQLYDAGLAYETKRIVLIDSKTLNMEEYKNEWWFILYTRHNKNV